MANKIILLFISIFVGVAISLHGQTTKVRGKISDASTGEPLPFVNVSFRNSTIGTITDFNGTFFLETRTPTDSLIVSYIGYQRKALRIQKNTYQDLAIKLEPDNIKLAEVVVVPGENPAHIILKNIIKNKADNNPAKFDSYQYEVYNKMELDVNNIDEDFKEQKVFKHFQFIFDYIDTSVVTGKNYLPVFITETLSDYYYQGKPKKAKEVIKASQMSGVQNDNITQYTGQMYLEVNIYDNTLWLFTKEFISPISNFGLLYYKYYLIDSAFINNNWCYQISFKPKRKQELTFTGDFWVHDTTFAIKKIQMRIADDANINFVNDMVASFEFERIDNKNWFPAKNTLFVDFNITDQTTGFFGHKTTSYKNVKINILYPEKFFSENTSQETINLEDALKNDSEFWKTARHEELTKKEEDIYQMVDSIKEVPVFKTFVDLVTMFVSGYWVRGNFEFGPYYTFYSFNAVEGNRVRIGGRTSNKFSTRIMYFGHVAYGDQDNKLKGGIGTMYMLNKAPRKVLYVHLMHDIEQLGQSQNAFMQDNILSSLLRREYNYKLTMVNQAKAYYEHEWFRGFQNRLTLKGMRVFSTDSVPFEQIKNLTDTIPFDHVTSTEITLNTRVAYNERIVAGEFDRVSMGTDWPIFNLDLTMGVKGILMSRYEYYKVHASIEHMFNIAPIGYLRYIVDAGKYWGRAPYPFLQLHEGNETYAFDDYAFNMMNYYEFVSDQYASLYLEHHWDGFIFNKVPLFRKLKWREVVSGKALIGNVSDKAKDVMLFPYALQGLSEPYYEAGVGVENILKLFRVDAMWRLSYLDNPNIPKFGIRAKLQIQF